MKRFLNITLSHGRRVPQSSRISVWRRVHDIWGVPSGWRTLNLSQTCILNRWLPLSVTLMVCHPRSSCSCTLGSMFTLYPHGHLACTRAVCCLQPRSCKSLHNQGSCYHFAMGTALTMHNHAVPYLSEALTSLVIGKDGVATSREILIVPIPPGRNLFGY